MGKPSAIGPGTEVGKQILDDFKNWKETGFKPWGKGVGGANHYKSKTIYRLSCSQSAFRSQAVKIAKIALEQMPACEVECRGDDDVSMVRDSENKNPWQRQLYPASDKSNSSSDSDANDDNYEDHSDEETADFLDDFEEILPGELMDPLSPLLSEYPCGRKLLAVFPLDGNVKDMDSHLFQFVDDHTAIQRWSKVPKDRESAVKLIGFGDEKESSFGYTDIALVVLDAAIKKIMKENESNRDASGDIWEVRDTLRLPFKVRPKLFSKTGKVIETFCMRTNKKGYGWAYFWLLAWKPPTRTPPERKRGQRVTPARKDSSSVYTEKTVV